MLPKHKFIKLIKFPLKNINSKENNKNGKKVENDTQVETVTVHVLEPNTLQVNQDKLADDLGVDKSRVSQMIQNLIDEKLIQLYSRNKSKNNNFMYNTYLLNY